MRLLVAMVTCSHLSCWAFWGCRWPRSLEAAACVDGGSPGCPGTDRACPQHCRSTSLPGPVGPPPPTPTACSPRKVALNLHPPCPYLQHPWACDLGAGDWLILCDCPASTSQADAGNSERPPAFCSEASVEGAGSLSQRSVCSIWLPTILAAPRLGPKPEHSPGSLSISTCSP